MQINYSKYLKYKLLLQIRRNLFSIERFLKKFFPRISYNKILSVLVLKYVIEVVSISLITYVIFKNNIKLTNELIFPVVIFYLLIYSIKMFTKNYNKVITPENVDFLKTFPINNLGYNILIAIDSFLFCIFGSFFKKVLQIYLPCILVLKESNLFNGSLLVILILYISFCIANIIIYIKFFVNNYRISFFKTMMYALTCTCIYKGMKKFMYNLIMLLNTFPYESLKHKDADYINDWINITSKSINENIMFYVNKYFLNVYSPISNLKGIAFGDKIIFNGCLLVLYILVLTIIFIILSKYVDREKNINTIRNNDLVGSFIKLIILIINKVNMYLKIIDDSIYNIIIKDLKIFNNYREVINNKLFNIFGGFSLWIFFAFIISLKAVLDFSTNNSYMKSFNIMILFFLPLFVLLHFHENLKNSFKFIFFIDGENRNINLFKITGYPIEKLFKSKKIIFFIFSSILYVTIFISYIVLCKLNLKESIILLLNFICIYYFGCNFYLIGSLLNSNFRWSHIDDQGNDIGQKYISDTLINVFAFFYSIILAIFSILYYIDAFQLMFFIYIATVLILLYIYKFMLKRALVQVNSIMYSE